MVSRELGAPVLAGSEESRTPLHGVLVHEPMTDDDFVPPATGGAFSFPMDISADEYHQARENVLSEFEKGYIVWLVNRAGGNMSKAARLASIDRTTLYRLMEKHSFRRDELSSTFE